MKQKLTVLFDLDGTLVDTAPEIAQVDIFSIASLSLFLFLLNSS